MCLHSGPLSCCLCLELWQLQATQLLQKKVITGPANAPVQKYHMDMARIKIGQLALLLFAAEIIDSNIFFTFLVIQDIVSPAIASMYQWIKECKHDYFWGL